MARKIEPNPKRPPYFVRVAERGTWQLLAGGGSPLTAPRREADGPAGDQWRADVLHHAKATGARVMSGGAWIGRVTDRGAFVYFHANQVGEGGAA